MGQPPSGIPRRPPRRWAGPAVSLVILAFLVGITAILPYHQFLGGYSVAAAWLHAHVLPSERNITRATGLDLYFVREADGIHVVDDASASAGETEGRRVNSPADVLTIRYRPERRRFGWWGITQQVDHHALKIDGGAGFSPAQQDAARGEFLERARATLGWVPPDIFARLGRGEIINESRWLPAGFAVNALTIALLLAFVFSLRWLRDLPAWIREYRRDHAIAAGRCPACGYSILNLRGSVCPECGKSLALP